MKLITSGKDRCVAASISMLLDVPIEVILEDLFSNLEKPFKGKWADKEKVPSIHEIVAYCLVTHNVALVPFEYDPQCTPCVHGHDPVPVYKHGSDVFDLQLRFGAGLIEGRTEKYGHMVAWDGLRIYDPRGYRYHSFEGSAFGFTMDRFWLAS